MAINFTPLVSPYRKLGLDALGISEQISSS